MVVGGGITGLTAAYLLAAAGRSVAVLEGHAADIDTGHVGAPLMVADLPLTKLVSGFGRDHARAVWDAGCAAIAQIDELVREEDIGAISIGCQVLYAAVEKGREVDADSLREEATLASELGFDATFVDDVPLVHVPGVMVRDQARFHPLNYLAGLARAIVAHGGHIYEHTDAKEFSDAPLTIKANGRDISCEHIVRPRTIRSSETAASPGQPCFRRSSRCTSYVVAGRIAKGIVPDALLWDTADPYHYFRIEPRSDHDLVIYGGEDHKTGQADDTSECYERLEQGVRALVPGIDVTHRWSGQVIETPDGLPYIGETADHQFAATGFSGNGMTFGTLGGMMAADHILGRSNPWSDLFDPGRRKLRHAAWDYLRENKDYPYYLIRDRFAGAEARSLRAVKRGEGKIIEYGGEQVAAYRDESGTSIVRSAICTHLGCLVDWNEAERTWDCPCHGSHSSQTAP